MTPQRYTLFLNAHKKAAEIHQPLGNNRIFNRPTNRRRRRCRRDSRRRQHLWCGHRSRRGRRRS